VNQGLNISERLKAASALPDGARFYRCALQAQQRLSMSNQRTSFSPINSGVLSGKKDRRSIRSLCFISSSNVIPEPH